MKKLTCMLLAGILVLQPVMNVQASAIQDAKEKKEEAQSDLNSVTNSIDAIESSKEEAKAAIETWDAKLVDVLVSIDLIKTDLENKQTELDTCRVDLDAAKATEAKQYEDMKKRIRFMYENGDTTLISVLLESESITDLLNKAEYVDKIYESDRELLTKYQEAKDKVQALETQLEADKADLESLENEQKAEKDNYETLIAEKKDEVDDFDAKLATAKEKAASLQSEIQAQTDAIRAEEQRQAQAAAAAAAASSSNSNQSTSNNSNSNSSSSNNSSNTTAPTGSGTGSAVVAYACQFIGNSYVWGGTSLTDGADCSGFTQSVFANFGVSLPRTSGEQRGAGVEVSYADAQPGDLICYSGHVAIYMGGGQIVHAANSAIGITTGNATYRTILSVRRVI